MLNSLANAKFDLNGVTSMMRGHRKFLERNTGQTDNAKTQHWVLNPQHILSNNRHFTNQSMQEGQPNGDATTEGQSLLILGFIYSYMATGEQTYLDDAIKYFDAYLNYFYADKWDEDNGSIGHNPIPDTPSTWVCNWIVNGKEPVDSDYPIADDGQPTHGGFREIKFTFDNSLTLKIPHGAPYWGEYLDKCPFAFDGLLGWDSIVATVYGTKEAVDDAGVTVEVIDWSVNGKKRGKQYDVDWIIDLYGHKVNWPDGMFVDKNPDGTPVVHPVEDRGTVKLKPTYNDLESGTSKPTPPGEHKLNFAVKLPAEHGGFVLQRNKPWHNRPVNVPVAYNKDTGHYDILNQMGNASDAEQWFGDACYLLFKITGDGKYYNAYQAVIYNADQYSDIDSVDKFFRKSINSKGAFTDGIAYDYFYPDDYFPTEGDNHPQPIPDTSVIGRDGSIGYITGRPNLGIQRYTMEQQAVWYKVNSSSVVSVEAGGRTDDGDALMTEVTVQLSKDKTNEAASITEWKYDMPTDLTGDVIVTDIPLSSFLSVTKPDGSKYRTMDKRSFASWNGSSATVKNTFVNNVLNDRGATVAEISWLGTTSSSDGVSMGLNWLDGKDAPKVDMKTITLKSDVGVNLIFEDEEGWRWVKPIAQSGGVWKTVDLSSGWTFNNYQPNHEHPAWWREIWNDKDLGSSHEDWYIPSGDRPMRMYYNGQLRGEPMWQDANGHWHFFDIDSYGYIWGHVHLPDGSPGGLIKDGFNPNEWEVDNPGHWVIKAKNGRVIYDMTPKLNPVSHLASQLSIEPQDGTTGGTLQIYCVNEIPVRYSDPDPTYLMLFRLEFSTPPNDKDYFNPKRFTFQMGDCFVKNYMKDNLKFTPGVVPFSNIYSDAGTETFDGWHGMPYPGYQYPFMWLEFDKPGFELRLNNMVNFMYESQQEYHKRYGILGPGMSAYVWNRWDNYKYGKPDTWTEYHWGDGHAWSGYQPRAYYGACRALYELQLRKQAIPEKLIEYVGNWAKYLHTFISDSIAKFHRPMSPTEWYFPKSANDIADSDKPFYKPDGIARPNPNDFTGHMCALWLAGSCYLALSDTKNVYPEIQEVIEWLAEELNYNYQITGVPNKANPEAGGAVTAHAMDGSWTPTTHASSGFGSDCTGLFYGFWAGEIMRGLAMYLLYKQMRAGEDMFQFTKVYKP